MVNYSLPPCHSENDKNFPGASRPENFLRGTTKGYQLNALHEICSFMRFITPFGKLFVIYESKHVWVSKPKFFQFFHNFLVQTYLSLSIAPKVPSMFPKHQIGVI